MEINNNRKDWALEKLGDFADYEKGKKPKNQSPIQTEIFKYPYVNIQAFEKGIIDEYTDGEKCNFCSENDFLMVWDGSRFGLIGKGIKGAIGSTLMKIDFPGIENHFAYYFLKSKYLEINSKPKGTGTPHVNPELLWNYIFPIAPLPEQRAIISKIEQLFSDLDNGIENFKKAQAQLKLYRQSVLKAACEGKLVPNEAELARAEGRDYEAADVLLGRILKERREKWNGKGKYKEAAAPDVSGMPELPEGWEWETVEQVGDINEQAVLTGPFGSNLGREDFMNSGVPVLTIGCLTEQGLSLKKAVYISKNKASELGRYKVKGGDVLFSRMATVGRADLVLTKFEGSIINYHLMRLRLAVTVIYPIYFISYVRGSQAVVDYIKKVNHGATRDGINTNQLLNLPIALPPLAEQRRIVSEVERRLTISDKMEATIAESLEKAESLRQSILKKAFEGKLLNERELEKARNASDWEPAEKLLERIRQEKARIGEKKSK